MEVGRHLEYVQKALPILTQLSWLAFSDSDSVDRGTGQKTLQMDLATEARFHLKMASLNL